MRSSISNQRRASILSRTDCAHCRGFSFVEIVVVLLIMGILAAVAAPTFVDSLLFHRVETAARRVKADLDLARNTARLTSASQKITFDNDNKTYTASAAVKDLDRLSNIYSIDLSEAPYNLTVVTADFGDLNVPSSEAIFDGYGKPARGGTVLLQIDSDHQCTVTLDGTTGHVTITSNQSRGRAAEAVGN